MSVIDPHGRFAGGDADDDRTGILVVDDLPEKLLVFRTVLEELGQDLVLVRSGGEALREVLHRDFAVILLDVNMPDIDGFETAGLIRKYKRSAHTPIIFITAYTDEMQTALGYSLGAVDYILSPVVPEVRRAAQDAAPPAPAVRGAPGARGGRSGAAGGGREHAPLELPGARQPGAG